MELNRIRHLAGLEQLVESLTISGEAKADINYTKAGQNQKGDVITILSNPQLEPVLDAIADLLGVSNNWQLIKVGTGFVAYQKSDRFVFFANQNDFQDMQNQGT